MPAMPRRAQQAWIESWRMSCVLPLHRLWPFCFLGGSIAPIGLICNYSRSSTKAGSGRKPDLPSGRRVVAGEFGGALLQPPAADKTDQCLNRRAEIAALPHQQVEMLPKQRDKIEPRRFRGGPRRDAAVGLASADRGREIRAGQAGRLEPVQIVWFDAGALDQHVEQHLRPRAGLPD